VLVLRLDVPEDHFVERCPEFVIRDVCTNPLQVLLREVFDFLGQMSRGLRVERLLVRFAFMPVQRGFEVSGASGLKEFFLIQERKQLIGFSARKPLGYLVMAVAKQPDHIRDRALAAPLVADDRNQLLP